MLSKSEGKRAEAERMNALKHAPKRANELFQWIHAAAFIDYHFDPVAALPASNLQMNYMGLRGEVCMESP